MEPSEMAQFIIDSSNRRVALFANKSADYATEDALSNFKRVHQVCKVWNIDPRRSPADCAIFMAILKQDRWFNLRNKKTKPKNEKILDTLDDLHNYFDLAFQCDEED